MQKANELEQKNQALYDKWLADMKDLEKDIDFGEIKYARAEKATFCGRSYQQAKDGSINVTMEDYMKLMQTVRVSRDRSKAPDSA